MNKKILGVRTISGDVFFGTVNKGIISEKAQKISKQDFENCMIEFIYHHRKEYNSNDFFVNLSGKKYKLHIRLTEEENGK